MDNITHRYYTPGIEEFHFGFEYEWSEYGRKIWIEEVCEWDDLDLIFDDFAHQPKELFERSYRVKYLDKSDIEYFEFKQGKLPYQYFNGIYKLIILEKTKISIEHIADDLCVFYGDIKNKSELKTLLKQLNII